MAARHHQTLRRIGSSEARAALADLLEAVGDRKERILIERRGKSAVALISADDLLRLQMLEARRAREVRSERDAVVAPSTRSAVRSRKAGPAHG